MLSAFSPCMEGRTLQVANHRIWIPQRLSKYLGVNSTEICPIPYSAFPPVTISHLISFYVPPLPSISPNTSEPLIEAVFPQRHIRETSPLPLRARFCFAKEASRLVLVGKREHKIPKPWSLYWRSRRMV